MTVRIILFLSLLLAAGACTAPRGVYHTVAEGQTLYRIGKTYGVDERYLARINRIDDPARLRTGTRLYIPGADRVREVPGRAGAAPPLPKPTAPARITPAVPKAAPVAKSPSPPPAPVVRPQGASPGAGKPTLPSSAAAKGKFDWPLKGSVLKGFGGDKTSPIKGLEIAAAHGTPILSAAAGRVIYSGDGIRSYGNLIILKHDDDFFTVYAYNQKNAVVAGAFVSKGERIAYSGAPPGGGKPRLYFEIRRGKEPVDPIFYLP